MRNSTFDRHYAYGNFEEIAAAVPLLTMRQIRNGHRTVVKSLFKLEKFKEAKEFLLNRVLGLVKDDEFDTKEAYLLVAGCCLSLNEPEQALHYTKLAKKIDRDDYEVHYLTGRALLLLDRREEGMKSLSKAAGLDCVHFSRAYRLARIALKKGDEEGFLKFYVKTREYADIEEEVFCRFFIERRKGFQDRVFLDRCVDTALNHFEHRDADLESFLAQALFWTGGLERAREVARGCLEIDPFNPFAFLVLATVAQESNRPEEVLGFVTLSLLHHIFTPSDFRTDKWATGLQFNPLIYTKKCRTFFNLALEAMGGSHCKKFEFASEEPSYRDLKKLREYALSGGYNRM